MAHSSGREHCAALDCERGAREMYAPATGVALALCPEHFAILLYRCEGFAGVQRHLDNRAAEHAAAIIPFPTPEAAEREHGDDVRGLIDDIRQHVAETREAARLQLAAVRADPLYDLYRRWAGRLDRGTVYDAEHYRRAGRLVAVTERTRYAPGGAAKRALVDFTDILDREAQEHGITAHELPACFERVRRQLDAAEHARDAAEQAARDAETCIRELQQEVA